MIEVFDTFLKWLFKQTTSTILTAFLLGSLVYMFNWTFPENLDKVLDYIGSLHEQHAEQIEAMDERHAEQMREVINALRDIEDNDSERWGKVLGGPGMDRVLPGWKPDFRPGERNPLGTPQPDTEGTE